MKNILILGGSPTQLPLIKKAKFFGKVIVCDIKVYKESNKIADKYYKISTTNKKELSKVVSSEKINACMTHASDPSSIGVSYVNSILNNKYNNYDIIRHFQNKLSFRKLQKKLNLFTPYFREASSIKSFLRLINGKKFDKKIIIKPVDASGSKGVGVVNKEIDSLIKKKKIFKEALKYSREKKVIIENYIEMQKPQIAGDGFVDQKKINFFLFKEHFSLKPNKMVPIGESHPYGELRSSEKSLLKKDISKIMSHLKYFKGPFNIDARITKNNEIFIMELGPRSGGNLIPELIEKGYQFQYYKNSIKSSLGLKINQFNKFQDNYICSFVIHSTKSGIFKKVVISKKIKKNIDILRIFKKKGDKIYTYTSASRTVGLSIMKFKNYSEMNFFLNNYEKFLKVELQ